MKIITAYRVSVCQRNRRIDFCSLVCPASSADLIGLLDDSIQFVEKRREAEITENGHDPDDAAAMFKKELNDLDVLKEVAGFWDGKSTSVVVAATCIGEVFIHPYEIYADITRA